MIRLLLLAFPPAWRRRYGAELSELVAAEGLSPRVAVDLLRAGVAQRWRSVAAALNGGAPMVIGPAWRHPTGWAVAAALILLPTVAFTGGSMLAYGAGIVAVRGVMEPVTNWLNAWRPADLLLVAAPAVALLAATAPLLRLQLRREQDGRQALVAVRVRWLNVLVSMVALAAAGALAWYFLGEVVLSRGA